MSHRIKLILLVIGSCFGVAFAQQPNHLEPIDPRDPHGYNQALFDTLIGSDIPALWMICIPSRAPEFALILRSEPIKKGEDVFALNQSAKWTLECATATKMIWQEKKHPTGNNQGVIEVVPRDDVRIDRTSITINEPLAHLIERAWVAMLRSTRYPEADNDNLGFDGATYRFHANRYLFGETSSFSSGLPADLVALAIKLTKLVEGRNDDHPRLIKECTADAKKLEEAARAASAKNTSK